MKQIDLNKVRWKTELCTQGESCWCRIITLEETIIEDGDALYIAASGCVPKDNAEHIVTIHNRHLENEDRNARLLTSCQALLSLVAEAIMHGMPITEEVANIRNEAVKVMAESRKANKS